MSRLTDAWRNIAHRESGGETLTMSRSTLRELFDEMDARASRAEADADRLARVLREGIFEEIAEAQDAHEQAVAQR